MDERDGPWTFDSFDSVWRGPSCKWNTQHIVLPYQLLVPPEAIICLAGLDVPLAQITNLDAEVGRERLAPKCSLHS